MIDSDTPTTLSRVQQRIESIRDAETEELSRICKHMCAGYLLALLFEGLIDNNEHTELEAAAERARAQWLPPAERESAE
jgi:hypothetical protein